MKNNWQTKKLKELCDLQNGFAFKSKDYITDSNTMNFRMSQIRPTGTVDLFNNPKFLPDSYAEKYKSFLLNDGDIVVAMTDLATETKILGVPTIVHTDGKKLLLNQRVGRLIKIDFDSIYVPFLKYALTTPQVGNYYKSLGRGGLQINISKEQILNVEISYPDISEQKRIVKTLDQVFENINKAKENTEKNLFNCRQLFEKYSHTMFLDVDKNEETKNMGEICDFLNGYAFKSSDAVNLSNTQLIRMGNLYKNNLDLERRAVYYPNDFSEKYKRYLLSNDDLIISLTGTTGKEDYGYTVRIPKTNKKLLLNQRISKIIILNNKNTDGNYLLYYLLSRSFLDKLYKTAHGTRQANLSTDSIKAIKFGVPDIFRQKEIVKKLDLLSEQTKKLEENYKQKLLLLDELKKSVLQKAFGGNL